MTIYQDSKRIVKLSTDAVETVTYTGDMSTGWTTGNAGSGFTLDGTNDEIDFLNNYGNDNVAIDLNSLLSGSISTSWVLRFAIEMSGTASGDNIIWWNGVSSDASVEANSTAQSYIGIGNQTQNGTTGTRTYIAMCNDSRLDSSDVQTRLQLSGSNTADFTGKYYFEIIRDGSNFTVNQYSDSYSTLSGTKTNAISNEAGGTLRYFISANYQQGSNVTGTLSELKFYDGVSSLTSKPTDVQDNSILVEKDTAKRYWSSGYFPSATVTRSDDFSSDGWTDNDSTNMGVSGGSFNWNAKRDGTNDASVYDLTSTSANWVLRFKLTVTNVSSSTQAGNGFYVGLSDSIQTAGQSTSQDFIGVSIYNDNTDTYRTIDADGSALPAVYSGDSSQVTTYSTGSVWYYEIIKTGSSYTVEAFSGSDYSTGSEGKITGSSPASGLRYLKVLNDMASIPTSTNPFQGTINALKFYDGVTNVGSPATWTLGFVDERGVFAGGLISSTSSNVMDYINIATLGNATDFGDLTVAGHTLAGGVTNGTRGVFAGGNNRSNIIDYITIATIGNATDFGDLTGNRSDQYGGITSTTRGIWSCGYIGGNTATIDYITIATTGNASDFGDATVARREQTSTSNDTRGLTCGGWTGANSDVIDYVTIATTGNATDFGNLITANYAFGGCSNTTRSVLSGGGVATNVIQYVTIATTGNATDFGDLLTNRYSMISSQSETRGVFAGGHSNSDIISYITIATLGNATDFGDLTVGRQSGGGTWA